MFEKFKFIVKTLMPREHSRQIKSESRGCDPGFGITASFPGDSHMHSHPETTDLVRENWIHASPLV